MFKHLNDLHTCMYCKLPPFQFLLCRTLPLWLFLIHLPNLVMLGNDKNKTLYNNCLDFCGLHNLFSHNRHQSFSSNIHFINNQHNMENFNMNPALCFYFCLYNYIFMLYTLLSVHTVSNTWLGLFCTFCTTGGIRWVNISNPLGTRLFIRSL